MLIGFSGGALRARLSLLTHLFALCAVSAVYRNRIVLNNIIKLQNINGMLATRKLCPCLQILSHKTFLSKIYFLFLRVRPFHSNATHVSYDYKMV